MKLSDSHKIPQEKWDFKISDVLITAWSRVQVLPGPPQKSQAFWLGNFCFGGPRQGLNKAAECSEGNQSPSGALVSLRVPISRNVCRDACCLGIFWWRAKAGLEQHRPVSFGLLSQNCQPGAERNAGTLQKGRSGGAQRFQKGLKELR